VEKILEEHETLRPRWPVHGTTGYDALSEINAVQLDSVGVDHLRAMHEAREGRGSADAHAECVRAKRQIMDQELASELTVLATETTRLLKRDPLTRDFSRGEIRQALREIVSRFPVYRGYVGSKGASAEDARDLDWALGLARRARAVSHPMLFDVLEALLKGTWRQRADGRPKAECLRLARKFQQFTGPAMAKGMEDTTFYRVVPLVCMNEVGMGPQRRVASVEDFHQQMQRRADRWPWAMLTTATHDTKRGEDVRARIAVLSEKPADWAEHVERWQILNRRARQEFEGAVVPSSRDEYLIYQTLVGIWPMTAWDEAPPGPATLEELRQRLQDYMIKAAREAKTHTSWLNVDETYETGLNSFVARILDDSAAGPFLRDVQNFVQGLAAPGACNALTQMLLRLTIPGVPDTYQGMEFWDDSLVDPDNRRPVDFVRRAEGLNALQGLDEGQRHEAVRDMAANWPDGRLKQYLLWQTLQLRHNQPDLFLRGTYLPLRVTGPRAAHVLAFARVHGNTAIVAALPRLMSGLCPPDQGFAQAAIWENTTVLLPPDLPGADRNTHWRNTFTGQSVQSTRAARKNEAGLPCADLFANLPAAILQKSGAK
jgi:(1->4)-alpha-D-glucan 1-alpha-D-glucosylmutase